MKKGIHPDTREVVFQDMSNGKTFIISSTIQTRESIEVDGKTYPLSKVEVSSESHPFYTGEQNKLMDTTGRVEKFRRKFGNRAGAKAVSGRARAAASATGNAACSACQGPEPFPQRAAEAALFCPTAPRDAATMPDRRPQDYAPSPRMRSVVRLTASATRALPRWVLLTICVMYASFGLFGRDPWKNEDAAGFGVMWTMATGDWRDWLLPNLVSKPITTDGPLAYWIGAAFIRLLNPLVDPSDASRIYTGLFFCMTCAFVWYSAYLLGRRPEVQPFKYAFGGEPLPRDYGRTLADGALLIVLGCFGLAERGHETTPQIAEMTVVAILLYGLSGACNRIARVDHRDVRAVCRDRGATGPCAGAGMAVGRTMGAADARAGLFARVVPRQFRRVLRATLRGPVLRDQESAAVHVARVAARNLVLVQLGRAAARATRGDPNVRVLAAAGAGRAAEPPDEPLVHAADPTARGARRVRPAHAQARRDQRDRLVCGVELHDPRLVRVARLDCEPHWLPASARPQPGPPGAGVPARVRAAVVRLCADRHAWLDRAGTLAHLASAEGDLAQRRANQRWHDADVGPADDAMAAGGELQPDLPRRRNSDRHSPAVRL
ncbi:hypothetical protein DFQ28_002343 [Apophysomyces sp. BC1034]|nr:hypothetical protein DFQ28_002343 [Apophysomyces sp. BC1034]